MRHLWMLALLASPALADQYGTTNPEELTWRSVRDKAERGQTDMMTCAAGYMMTKSGDHDTARAIFEACAAAGYTRAMTWMSYMEQNGFGGAFNPEAAADWDRQAAEAGDPVGQFNHGLDLMRGFGTRQDEARGRDMIDRAAHAGLEIAQRLQGADYNLDEVTPDADNWRYAPLF
ncbi:sel1 repeat family protein [Citreicella sp. C3M06]|uniref:tetratricopeptide repeat protein n=1 Tax=Roseobacteraceae TaxID=2854170 RepID=UPI001C0865FF|nr:MULTISPECIES: sel1 repeat family protein [Roseobacteraceae]MBU2962533.1 sel1 repeat family protein [Citreicella sp. C3M06]MDO6585415.1 sel1 repeat family protein [Salipiger sp. 1_MG-2023]